MKNLLRVATFSLALLSVADLAGAQQLTQFPEYSTLTGNEVIQDQANPTGAYFTANVMAAFSQASSAGVNAQTGTTYTVVAADAGKLVTFSNASPVTVTIPVATTSGFGSGKTLFFENKGAGAVTLTPATSTINGSSTLVLRQNRGIMMRSDGTNYQIDAGAGALSATPVTVPEGGTGAATLTAHGVLLGEGTSAVTPTSVGTTGTLLQGSTSADPSFSTTLSGSYVFSNPLITTGIAAGTPTHIATAALTAPALTSCGGGSPAITGTDTAGIVTMGTSATGCVITFNVAYTTAPFCVVSWIATPLASQSYVTSNTAITLTQTSASANQVQYICLAQAGG